LHELKQFKSTSSHNKLHLNSNEYKPVKNNHNSLFFIPTREHFINVTMPAYIFQLLDNNKQNCFKWLLKVLGMIVFQYRKFAKLSQATQGIF
jgi:hypothetical protein